MTVDTWDPNAHAKLSMTDAAIAHISQLLTAQPQAKGVLLGVKKSGCSGFKFDFNFTETLPDACQSIVINEQITVFVPLEAAPYVQDLEIDFAKEGLNSSIKFNNPHAKDVCGCGESFSA